jgi:hypothetical protein
VTPVLLGKIGAPSMLSASRMASRPLILLMFLFQPAPAAALVQEEPQRVRVDHPGIVITVALGSVATFEEVPIFEVFFPTRSEDGEIVRVIGFPDSHGISTRDSLRVFLILPLIEDLSSAIDLETCTLIEGSAEQCESAFFSTRIPQSRRLLEIRLQRPIDWTDTMLRMTVPAGILRLDPAESEEGLPNPGIQTLLPVLSMKDLRYVESKPVLKFEISPLARDANTREGEEGREAVAFDFDGGMFRSSGEQRYGLTWGGHVATQEELSFNQLALNLEYERNLHSGSFIPLVLALSGEADQDFDVVDTSARLELRFLLPFSLNQSPYHSFVPALGPKIKLIGSFGHRVRGADETVDEGFRRFGYEIHWKIPLRSDSVLRLHHAGLHDQSDLPDGDEFHSLVDFLLQTTLGELTYFIGFQEGEAPPLFQATETVRAGVVVSFQ